MECDEESDTTGPETNQDNSPLTWDSSTPVKVIVLQRFLEPFNLTVKASQGASVNIHQQVGYLRKLEEAMSSRFTFENGKVGYANISALCVHYINLDNHMNLIDLDLHVKELYGIFKSRLQDIFDYFKAFNYPDLTPNTVFNMPNITKFTRPHRDRKQLPNVTVTELEREVRRLKSYFNENPHIQEYYKTSTENTETQWSHLQSQFPFLTEFACGLPMEFTGTATVESDFSLSRNIKSDERRKLSNIVMEAEIMSMQSDRIDTYVFVV